MAGLDYVRRVVVDDTDPRITYDTGTWDFDASSFNSFGERGDPYNQTMKGTNSAQAGFTFTFEGDFVQVKGAKDNRRIIREPNSTKDSIDLLPKYTCQIDNITIGTVQYDPFMYATTNLILCEQARLSKRKHTVTINVTVDDPRTQVFWLDSIEYSPLDTTDVEQEVLKVKSSDTRSCFYHNETKGWETWTSQSEDTRLIWTVSPGTTMSFRFNGTFVALYGSLTHPRVPDRHSDFDETTGSYYIDNGNSASFELARSDHLPSSPDNYTIWSNRQFFNVSLEDDGREHEMVITYSGAHNNPDEGPQWLAVDYFYVKNDGMSSKQGNKTTPSDEGTPGIESQSDTGGKTPIGPIVGGVVGGIVVLLIVGVVIWLFRSRNHRKEVIAPYTTQVTDTTDCRFVGEKSREHSQSPPRSYSTRDVSGLGELAQPEATGDLSTRRHQDSGIRYNQPMEGSLRLVDLPPTYTSQ
ncbi:hypothetical protein AAF712_013680 [Marasmius tenuissimus]|uniref:Uncharacterized protein n=1 Tax=Marasmius tenuissimus TaxID=585030 RepID=A0ABR2ZF41_9AGAR|nr:hypothetical protein PM082_024350 [Marasmius tenuissimus]